MREWEVYTVSTLNMIYSAITLKSRNPLNLKSTNWAHTYLFILLTYKYVLNYKKNSTRSQRIACWPFIPNTFSAIFLYVTISSYFVIKRNDFAAR